MRTSTLLATLACTLVAPCSAHAQAASDARLTAAGADAERIAVKPAAPADTRVKWLRNLMIAQERFYSTHGTYTTDLLALEMLPDPQGLARADSVSVRVLFAGGGGWSGVAQHRGQRGQSCVVFVGEPGSLPMQPVTQAERAVATEDGRILCDRVASSPDGRER